MKNNYLFVGLGQAGSKIADEAFKRGFNAVAINSAQSDLVYLSLPNEKKIFLESSKEGTGKNREAAQELIKSYMREILFKVDNDVENADGIIVCASLGGGFGSGSAPIVMKALETFNKDIHGIFIIPSDKESYRAKQNTVEAFSEISKLKSTAFHIFIDNEKVNQNFPLKALKDQFDISNSTPVSNLKEIISKADEYSYVKSLDGNDLQNILSERGTAVFEKLLFSRRELENIDLTEEIKKAFERSFQVNDIETALRACIIFNISEGYDKYINIDKIKDLFSKCYDFTYSVYYTNEDTNSLLIAVNGMSFPFQRISNIENSLMSVEKDIITSIENIRSAEYDAKVNTRNFLQRRRDTNSKNKNY